MSANEKEIRLNGVDNCDVIVDKDRIEEDRAKASKHSFADLLEYFWNAGDKEEEAAALAEE